MDAEQTVRLLVREHFDEAVRVGVRLGAAVRRHRELADLVRDALERSRLIKLTVLCKHADQQEIVSYSPLYWTHQN